MLEDRLDRTQNRLLASLPDAIWQRLRPKIEWVNLPLGQVLYHPDSPMSHVYFPATAVVSLLYLLADGHSTEIAVIGNEGVVGVQVFMGDATALNRAVVQSAGGALRLKSSVCKAECNQGGELLHLMLRFTQALFTQMGQTAVCNRHHTVDQQLCRRLLLSLDRVHGNQLIMTQELIANMLGVRREGVTISALKLQQAGLIEYARGHITVLDRAGLEKRVCECYASEKAEYDRLLPLPHTG